MTDADSVFELQPNGRTPDEPRTIADEASLAFVRLREGDYVSPPGRKDGPNDGASNRPRPLSLVAPSAHMVRGETRPALPLLAVLARISLEIAARESKTEHPVFGARESDPNGTEITTPNTRVPPSVTQIAKVHDDQSTGNISLYGQRRHGDSSPRRLATSGSSEVDSSLARRLTSVTRSGDGS